MWFAGIRISRRRDDDRVVNRGIVDDILFELRSAPSSPARIDDLGAHIDGVFYSFESHDNIGGASGSPGIVVRRGLHREDLTVKTDSSYAMDVICRRACDTCDE